MTATLEGKKGSPELRCGWCAGRRSHRTVALRAGGRGGARAGRPRMSKLESFPHPERPVPAETRLSTFPSRFPPNSSAPTVSMSMKRIGPIAQAWYKWKALRLPWRKRFFVGYDLHGNTYWEFRLTTRGDTAHDVGTAAAGSERWRRIVHYPRSTHYSDVRVSPLWHQWLRHTRPDAPSLAEQRDDVARQRRVKVLAAEADARWDAKPRVMEAPEDAAARSSSRSGGGSLPPAAADPTARDEAAHAEEQQAPQEQERAQDASGSPEQIATEPSPDAKKPTTTTTTPENDPWAKAKPQGPGETWQPTAWSPTAAKKR
ncbi:NADH dehydrogenase [ubiquinone] 1 alpha subcomplex assembly factor 2 [Purpureocillium lavendulum]|uniref:NADH dehydrogenase [ubiquinone] 1 alpha subcomplex assembly factor 2 n=1 Tax=Purpureocillium lavendulum TaxID=1247861 RepID=A0AB34G6Q4_9HYPO|nr:NADH dehydrogenase [ubiquinone] 1 alpha subcomplex assembly factor 2 [Purpureocillium lavendulum]